MLTTRPHQTKQNQTGRETPLCPHQVRDISPHQGAQHAAREFASVLCRVLGISLQAYISTSFCVLKVLMETLTHCRIHMGNHRRIGRKPLIEHGGLSGSKAPNSESRDSVFASCMVSTGRGHRVKWAPCG